MKAIITLILISSLSIVATAQKVDFLPASRFAPSPVAGADYLKDHVKQELNYPKELLENSIAGEVFIRFLVDNDGVVKETKITASTNDAFNSEALRYFNTIIWKKDPVRRVNPEVLDGIRIKFDPKYYQKTAKKRGYDFTEDLTNYTISEQHQVFNTPQLDSLPKLLSGVSMNEFAAENLKFPPEALARKVGGVVKYQFVIEPYGMASNFNLISAVAGGCNEETMRLIQLMRWTPGVKDGKAVRTKMVFSLLFNASGSGGFEMFDGNSNSSN